MYSKRNLAKKAFIFSSTILALSVFLLCSYFILAKSDKNIVSPQAAQEIKKPLHTKANPTKLEIEGVNINLPVVEGRIVNGKWEIADRDASHLDISANPGENGNIVIYGHNKRAILGSLPYVKIGSNVKVTSQDGQVYNYQVYSERQVKADDISIALATPSEVLTIYTCDGPLDVKRYVVQARLIKG